MTEAQVHDLTSLPTPPPNTTIKVVKGTAIGVAVAAAALIVFDVVSKARKS